MFTSPLRENRKSPVTPGGTGTAGLLAKLRKESQRGLGVPPVLTARLPDQKGGPGCVPLKPEGVGKGSRSRRAQALIGGRGLENRNPALAPTASTHLREPPHWAASSCEICNRLLSLPPPSFLSKRRKTDVCTLGRHRGGRL